MPPHAKVTICVSNVTDKDTRKPTGGKSIRTKQTVRKPTGGKTPRKSTRAKPPGKSARKSFSHKEIPSKNSTPLHLAAESGEKGVVQSLLRRGADPKKKDSDGNTPSDLARLNGHAAIENLFLEASKNASNDEETEEGRTAVHMAFSIAKETVLHRGWRHLNTGRLWTQLCGCDSATLDKEIDNWKDVMPNLLFAALDNWNDGLAKILLKHTVDVSVKDEYGWTLLHKACELGSAEIVSELVDRGAQIDERGPSGKTPPSSGGSVQEAGGDYGAAG
ncbi:hypothetical protein N7530_000143 [Penicillium desertorum]|uniref:Uncharacterized protein n=1 Tax=Penicillium desertorum TaxID=1303715 RepID=A0A9W9X7L5_9EURO|nr:hypothetical protein N7530_000143 [Penicillium desertorum]